MGTTTKIVFGSIFALSLTVMFLVFSMQKSAQLTLDIQAKEATLADVQQKMEEVRATAETATARNELIPKLQSSISSIEDEAGSYKKQIIKLQSNLDKQLAVIQKQTAEFSDLKKSYEDQEQALKESEKAKATADARSSETTEQFEATKEQLNKLHEEMSTSLTNVEQKSEAIAFYKEKLQAAIDETAAMKADQTSTQMNLELILDELAGKTQTISRLSARLEQLTGATGIPGEGTALLSQDETLPVTELEELQKINTTLQSKINEQSAVIDNVQETLRLTTDKLASVTKTNAELTAPLEERISILEQQFEDAMTVNTEKNQELADLKQSNSDLKVLAKILNADITSARSTLEDTKKQNIQLQERLETAGDLIKQNEEELLALNKDAQSMQVSSDTAEEQNTVLQNQIEELEATLANQRQEQAVKQKNLQDQLAALSGTAEELTNLKSSIDSLGTELSAKDSDISNLKEQLAASSAELIALRANLEETQGQRGIEEKFVENQNEQIAALTKDALAAKAFSDEQSKQLIQLHDQLTALQAKDEDTTRSTEQDERIAGLIEEVSAAKSLAIEQTAKLQAAEKILATRSENSSDPTPLEANIRSLKTALADAQQQLTALQAEVSTLKSERDQLLNKTTDSDNDGVSDADDSCQGTVANAEVNAKGCEKDSDSDGFVNRLDLCPDSPAGATVDNAGCADSQTTVVLQGITFQLGTAKLAATAKQTLNNAAHILENNPDIRMEVAGHTDSVGDSARNLQLSTQRAKAVMQYLVSRNISADRLQAKGYGASEPIADNATTRGRAQNRRVELRRVETSPSSRQIKEEVPPSSVKAVKEAPLSVMGD